MKVETPSVHNTVFILVIALLLSVIAYFLASLFAEQQMSPARLMAYGTLFGALLSGFLVASNLSSLFKSNNQVSVFVGNLAFKISPAELRQLFEQYGTVHNVRIMTDRATRRPKGFGFVEMDKPAAKRAITELNGSDFHGRDLKVNLANKRK